MTWAAANVNEIAARWRMARRLYPIYSQVDRSFEMGNPPCRELESPIDRLEPEVLDRVNHWFLAFDEKMHPRHLRQILQTSHLANAESLRDLLNWQLAHPTKSITVRDKVDYLVVQYFAQCAPGELQLKAPSFEQVADVLSEILGDVAPKPPGFSVELQAIMDELNSCSSLAEIFDRKIIERERALKEKSGGSFFLMPALVAFARCNYLLRHMFFRLLKEDLTEIRKGLEELEQKGRNAVDASSAGLATREPLESLRSICDAWKKQFLADYSPANFRQILEISKAIKSALKETGRVPVEEMKPERQATKETLKEVPPAQVSQPPVPAASVPRRTTTSLSITPAISLKLEDHIDQIAEYLITVSMAGPEVMHVMIGKINLALASWEVDAFVHLQDEVALAIQRAVGARLMLQKAAEFKRQTGVALSRILAIAHAEAAVIQERIAEAKDENDIDGAGRMAASAKRLLSQIEENGEVMKFGQDISI